MKRAHSHVASPILAGVGLLIVAGLTGCEVSDGSVPSVSTAPGYQSTAAAQKEMKDSVVGKWKMYPAIGPTKRNCSIEFKASAFDPHKGRVSTFACNLVEGLGSINGVSRINGWNARAARSPCPPSQRPISARSTCRSIPTAIASTAARRMTSAL